MYRNYLYITCTHVQYAPLTLDDEILGKKFSCIICTDNLESVTAKSKLNLAFFFWFILTKNKNSYSLYYILKHKIYIAFRRNVLQKCSYKNAGKISSH